MIYIGTYEHLSYCLVASLAKHALSSLDLPKQGWIFIPPYCPASLMYYYI